MKCIKRGEIPYCTFTYLLFCRRKKQGKKTSVYRFPPLSMIAAPDSGAQPAAVIKCVSSSRPRFFPVNLAGAFSRYAFWACVAAHSSCCKRTRC